jgi:hypothetical protein
MKARDIIVALVLSLAASSGAAGDDGQRQVFVFPGSQPSERGVACPLDEMKKTLSATNTEEVVAKLQALIPNVRKELADPFVSERLPFVRYEAGETGQKIADFYSRTFQTNGWKEGRGILGVEFTNCGGDWLRVFLRGTQQVLVHVCGPLERSEDETPETVVVRTITLRFRGIQPENVIAPENTAKERSEPQGGGYSPPAARSSKPTP